MIEAKLVHERGVALDEFDAAQVRSVLRHRRG